MSNKEDFFKTISNNINQSSFHVTLVQQNKNPRYAYTIGNLEKKGIEFVIAGNENYLYDEILIIFSKISSEISSVEQLEKFSFEIPEIGKFYLSKVHPSWSEKMMIGVFDYYDIDNFTAYQILPDVNHYTLDIPNMAMEWKAEEQPIWKWLDDNIIWNLDIPENSTVVTEIKVLFGEKVTEVMRWEEGDWQAFTQDSENINEEDMRVIPVATLIEIDKTLMLITDLEIGKGVWRDLDNLKWNSWV